MCYMYDVVQSIVLMYQIYDIEHALKHCNNMCIKSPDIYAQHNENNCPMNVSEWDPRLTDTSLTDPQHFLVIIHQVGISHEIHIFSELYKADIYVHVSYTDGIATVSWIF